MRRIIVAAGIAMAISAGANAQATANGTLTITGSLVGSLTLTIATHSNGATLTGSGSSAAGLALGTYSVNSPNTTINGITKSPGTGVFWLQTPISVTVTISNQTSSGYTLQGAMSQNDGNGYVFNNVAIGMIPVTITAAGIYGTPGSFTLAILIPTVAASGTINNTLNLTATAN